MIKLEKEKIENAINVIKIQARVVKEILNAMFKNENKQTGYLRLLLAKKFIDDSIDEIENEEVIKKEHRNVCKSLVACFNAKLKGD